MRRIRTCSAWLLLAIGGCSGGGGNEAAPPVVPPVTTAWHVPACGSVSGAPVTFTADGGLNRTPIQPPAAADYFTHGVAALAAGSTLAALVGTSSPLEPAELYVSTDAGCSWQASGHTLPAATKPALAAAGGYAYAWAEGLDTMYAIDNGGLVPMALPESRWSGRGPSSVGVDASNPQRIRITLYECERASCGRGSTIFETSNRGATWAMVGGYAPYGVFGVYFSPTNLDHMITENSTISIGHVSFDGGNLWLGAQGVPADLRAEEIAFGHDDQTVWLLAAPNVFPRAADAAAMFVSYDGGLNYQEAFAGSDENPLVDSQSDGVRRNAKIFPHPSDRDIVYLAYRSLETGTSYLYRYDAGLDELTKRQWPLEEGGVWSLAFNPVNLDVLYLGLAAGD